MLIRLTLKNLNHAAGNGSGNGQGNGSGNTVQERAEMLIEYLRDNPRASITSMSKEFGLSRRQIVTAVDYLKNQNRLKFVGTNRKGHWEVKDGESLHN